MSTKSMAVFEVTGTPVAQGSMRSPKAGVVLHNSDRLEGWRDAVGWAAKQEMRSAPPWEGPVEMCLYFTYKPRRKADSDKAKDTSPDVDKLARAVLDACTGILYRDDRQVSVLQVYKSYGTWESAADGGPDETNLVVNAMQIERAIR